MSLIKSICRTIALTSILLLAAYAFAQDREEKTLDDLYDDLTLTYGLGLAHSSTWLGIQLFQDERLLSNRAAFNDFDRLNLFNLYMKSTRFVSISNMAKVSRAMVESIEEEKNLLDPEIYRHFKREYLLEYA